MMRFRRYASWEDPPDDGPEPPPLCEHCQHREDTQEDDGGECGCPCCSGCGGVLREEDHSRCYLIDEMY